MAQYSFGSGTLYGRSTANATATPVEFGTLQDVSLDFTFTTKGLYGQYAFARAIARGTGKITGKASFGQLQALLFNDLFLNGTQVGGVPGGVSAATAMSNGSLRVAQDELITIAANGQVKHNGASYVRDLGVIYAGNGIALTRVASATPLVDQYAVNESTSNYAFNAALIGNQVLVSYEWQNNSGITIPITNTLVGVAPEFLVVFRESFNGKDATIVLNSCVSSKLSLATKIEDFTIPSFDFEAKADAGNNIGTISFDE